MSFKKLLCVFCCVLLCFTFSACNTMGRPEGGKPDDDRTPSIGDFPGGEIPDNNDVEVKDPDDADEHDFNLISQNGGVITYKCADCGDEETVVVSCTGGTQNAYAVDGSTITFRGLSEASTYDISGVFHGSLVIDVTEEYKFELQMSGLALYSHNACPITILSSDKVTLSAKKSTENYIYDMRKAASEDGISASVYALCDLDVQGKGSLFVKSTNNNGIHTKDDLSLKNLSLQVDCKDNALKGNDSVTVQSGAITLIARQGDGIKTTNSDVSSKGNQRGTVKISGGDILIYAACDGIDAAYDVSVDESTADLNMQIFTDKYSKYSEEVTAVADSVYYIRYNSTTYKYSLRFYNDESDAVWQNSSTSTTVGNYRYFPIVKPNGYAYVQLYIYSNSQQQGQDTDYVACTEGLTINNNYDTIALQSRGGSLSYGWTNYTTNTNQGGFGGPGGFGGMNDGNSDKGDHSTKGIKAANAINISAGTITVSAYDDAIHANNDAVLENGASPLGDVQISGGILTLRSNDDGIHGDNDVSVSGGTVNVISSYEGIEGTHVEISGGTVSVVSSDDGINGTATSGTSIVISGGSLYVYAGGDGVDSNSRTSYEGIYFTGGYSVIISTGNSDSSIDTESGYKYKGGYVVGIGRSGSMGSEATKCSNFSSVGTSKTISLQKDAYLVIDGIAAIKIPVTLNALIVCLGKTNASISSGSSTDYDIDSNGVYWVQK